MSQDDETIIALLHGPDQPGLVTRTTGWIYGTGGNVVHADLHRDPETAVFFQRIEWVPARGADFDKVQADFASFARGELAMTVQVARSSHQPKVGIMVSKIPHCFHDIMLRFQSGELRGHVACVVSNHRDLEEVTERYGVPFHHTPVTKETKAESEARQIDRKSTRLNSSHYS